MFPCDSSGATGAYDIMDFSMYSGTVPFTYGTAVCAAENMSSPLLAIPVFSVFSVN